MVRVLSIVFVTISVLQTAWSSALPIHAADECTSLGIIGGKNSTIENVPSAVSIHLQTDEYNYQICGGVIVHESFILTAAMCADGINTTSITVRVGSTYLSSGGAFFEVEKAVVHEKYDTENITNNVALLKLAKPILFGFLAKANLPTEDFEVKVGAEALFSGWGATNVNETQTEVFHQTTIPIKAQKCCKNPSGSILNDTSKICAGSPGHDACQGDGGSPLTQDGVLIGISSHGFDASCGVLPGIYTNIVKYVDWIKSTITGNL